MNLVGTSLIFLMGGLAPLIRIEYFCRFGGTGSFGGRGTFFIGVGGDSRR